MKTLILTLSFYSLAFALPGTVIPGESYPSRPITIVAPYPPGGPADIRARWLAEKLTPVLGQPIIVNNKAGAGGTIGTAFAAKSAADGYTFVIVHQGTLAIAPHIYSHTGYDPIRDLSPVARLDVSPLLLVVNPAVPAKSVADLLRLAKEKAGELNFGSAGIGSPPHIAGELFRRLGGIDVVHVPYKGASAALADLMGGQITYSIDNMAILLPQVRAGKIKALAVTSRQRVPSLPGIPTVAESGLPGYEYMTWMGICAPAGTPREIIARFNSEIGKLLRTPEARDWFAAQGAEPVADTPAEFLSFIKAEYEYWGIVVREAGIKAE